MTRRAFHLIVFGVLAVVFLPWLLPVIITLGAAAFAASFLLVPALAFAGIITLVNRLSK